MKTTWTIAAILAAVLAGTVAYGLTAEAAPEDKNNAADCIKAGYVWIPQPSTQASKNRPGVCSDEPVVNTITLNTEQTTTITVSAPSNRVQCHGTKDVGLRDSSGTYCVHQEHNDGRGRERVHAYACNGPYTLAPDNHSPGADANSTPPNINYVHGGGVNAPSAESADGWITQNEMVSIKGRQMRITGVGQTGTGYVSLTLYGTQRVRFTIEGYGHPDTFTWETQACALQVRVRVNVRGATNTSLNDAFTQARTNARELTTTGRTEGDYVPPNTNRCRVVRYDGGLNRASSGEMSWCGTYRGENNEEVAPNGESLSALCGRSNVTCHYR